MANKGKRLKKAYEGFDRGQDLPLEAAVKAIKGNAKTKFDETVEIAMNLGVDPRENIPTILLDGAIVFEVGHFSGYATASG